MSRIDSDLEVNAGTRRWTVTRFVPLRTFHLEQEPRLLLYFGVTNHLSGAPATKSEEKIALPGDLYGVLLLPR
jgi:hypothetical protein